MSFEDLVTRALTDESFRGALLENPWEVARANGYSVSEEEMSLLCETDLNAMAFELDERASTLMSWAG